MGELLYTDEIGGRNVSKSDVLNYVTGNPKATIVADLMHAPQIDSDLFDCIIITQTLQMIYQVDKVVATLHRFPKPGGVVLARRTVSPKWRSANASTTGANTGILPP